MREIDYDPSLLDDHEGVFDLDELSPDVRARIQDVVEALPEDERAVVECLIWGQERQVQVAARLGFSRSHVARLWAQARERLVEVLADLQ